MEKNDVYRIWIILEVQEYTLVFVGCDGTVVFPVGVWGCIGCTVRFKIL